MREVAHSSSADTPVSNHWAWARLLTALAVLLALVVWQGWLGMALFGVICGFFLLPLYFVQGLIVPLLVGHRCPDCGRRSLLYTACIPFGARFYGCKACGARCQRDDPLVPWQDASGPEFDAYFSSKPPQFPISWQLGSAAIALLPLLGVLLGSSLAFAFAPSAGVLVTFALWFFVFREARVPDHPTTAAGSNLWDRELDP